MKRALFAVLLLSLTGCVKKPIACRVAWNSAISNASGHGAWLHPEDARAICAQQNKQFGYPIMHHVECMDPNKKHKKEKQPEFSLHDDEIMIP